MDSAYDQFYLVWLKSLWMFLTGSSVSVFLHYEFLWGFHKNSQKFIHDGELMKLSEQKLCEPVRVTNIQTNEPPSQSPRWWTMCALVHGAYCDVTFGNLSDSIGRLLFSLLSDWNRFYQLTPHFICHVTVPQRRIDRELSNIMAGCNSL